MLYYVNAGRAGTPSNQYSDYLLLAKDPLSSDTYRMSTPVATLTQRAAFERDGTAAYQNALLWYLTRDRSHANKSIAIMDSWSSTIKSVDPTYRDRQLASSLGPFMMTNAAEIIRYTDAGWTAAGIQNFESMLTNVFYPRLNDHSGSQYEANVGSGNTKAMMAFGVFTQNQTMFNEAIDYYLNERCSGLPVDISPTGQASESGRDQQHVQLGLGNLAESCQIAAVQGSYDLYGLLSNRLLVGYEYTAKYNLGYTVPYDASFQRCSAHGVGGPFPTISTSGRGRFRPIYELAYAHYVSTKKLSMPYTSQIIQQVVTEVGSGVNSRADNSGWGTLKYRIN